MTELWIDGTAVVLSADFGTELKIENSFFTKNGEYTYDISLKLDNSVNVSLYSHLNRLNSVTEIKSKRQAILFVDNRVYVNGTEIITDWDDSSVTIQLASGNSELNYLIGSDVKISSLELGKVAYLQDTQNYCPALGVVSLSKFYPDVDYVLAPVLNRTGGIMVNDWRVVQGWDGSKNVYDLKLKRGNRYDNIAQPYLCTMIQKVIQALGYSLGTNQIVDSIYKNLYVVHTNATDEFAKMIPGWSVKDFFEELENLLNVVLVVNNRNKTVDIIFANRYYIGAKEVHLQQVEDEFEVEVDNENRTEVGNATVCYDLPESAYYQARKLSESIMNLSTQTSVGSFDAVRNYMNANKPAREVVTDTNTGREYIYKFRSEGNLIQNMMMVNEFKDLKRDTDEEIKLSLLPVEMTPMELFVYDADGNKLPSGTGLYPYTFFNWAVPVIESSTSGESGVGDNASLNDILENSISTEPSESKEKVYLAFYEGQKKMDSWYPAMMREYPLSFPDNVVFMGNMYNTIAEPEHSLRLSVLDTNLYSGTYAIDTTRTYTIYTYDPNLPDVHGIFVVHNKRFACKEMVFQISKAEKVKRWKAVLYPIKISDTESLQRWILADARWRDGGVWLDNGRWLDE